MPCADGTFMVYIQSMRITTEANQANRYTLIHDTQYKHKFYVVEVPGCNFVSWLADHTEVIEDGIRHDDLPACAEILEPADIPSYALKATPEEYCDGSGQEQRQDYDGDAIIPGDHKPR